MEIINSHNTGDTGTSGIGQLRIQIPEKERHDSQNPDSHDRTYCNFLSYTHLQSKDSRKWDYQNDNIIYHINNPQSKEKFVHLDTFPLRTTELCPEVRDRLAGRAHGDPNDDWVRNCQEPSN